jgi:uncharacterized protein (TIGR02757 family)
MGSRPETRTSPGRTRDRSLSLPVLFGPRRSDAELKAALDRFVRAADREALVKGDPVDLVRRYRDPHDQEVAGLIVAMLAYGRVASIKAKADKALELIGPHPARAVDRGRAAEALSGFVHRFQRGQDLPRFVAAIACVRREAGSLGHAFAACCDPAEPHYGAAMGRFVGRLTRAIDGRIGRGLRFLLPQPAGGGAAKRLCLYLRWMIRPDDGIDLGAWTHLADGLDPAKLLIPLDTHIERIGRYLGLTDRRASDLRTAVSITEALKNLRPEDPLYYDIALCHLGISGRCPRKRQIAICAECPIRTVCRLGREPRGWPYRVDAQ